MGTPTKFIPAQQGNISQAQLLLLLLLAFKNLEMKRGCVHQTLFQ